MTEEYQNNIQDKRISTLEEQFVKMCDHYNHQITDVNSRISIIEIKQESIRTDVSWIKKHYWIVVTASLGSLAGMLLNLLK